jgi:macrolide-specific efflux system membrane fusion protein
MPKLLPFPWSLAALAVLLGTPAVCAERVQVDSVLLTPIEELEVPAQEAGVLSRVTVSEGALVRPSELLAQIDDRDAALEKSRAEIELQSAQRNAKNDIKVQVAKKAAEVAAAELQRALDSRERYPKSVSETEVDRLRLSAERAALELEQAKYDYETAQLALRVSENQLQQAERRIERRRIVAPATGRVVQIFRRQGEWVEPGQPVVRMLRIDQLKAVGFLDAATLAEDPTGRPVVFRTTLPGEDAAEFSGKITFVHSEVHPVNGQVDFWAEIENPDLKLRPGLQGTLTIGEVAAQAARTKHATDGQ